MRRVEHLTWILVVSGCVGVNPSWGGEAADGSSTGTAPSSTSGVGESSPVSEDEGDATTVVTTAASTTGDDGANDSDTASLDTTSTDDGVAMEESTTYDPACFADPPAAGECPEQCENCNDGVCSLHCDGEKVCDGDTIACPDGWPCRVRCIGKQACKQATLSCPPEHGCNIECQGEQACQDASVACGSGTCSLVCTGDAQTCDHLQFGCGNADAIVQCDTPHDAPPTVTPANASNCGCELAGC